MLERSGMRGLWLKGVLAVAFALGVLFSTAISSAQYMRTTDIQCSAKCFPPFFGPPATCFDVCSGVHPGLSCTCTCNADEISGGYCQRSCDYGTLEDVQCSYGG
jgi:hypothetical protein